MSNFQRIYSLDLLKFILILFIAILHFRWTYLPQAYLCVEIFFVITGSLIYCQYNKYLSRSMLDSIIKRLMSFYPFYIMAILVMMCFIKPIHVYDVVKSLFFYEAIGLSQFKLLPGAYWFLGAYIYVFVFFILLIKSFEKKILNFVIPTITFLAITMMAHYSPCLNLNMSVEKSNYIFALPFGIYRAVAGMGAGWIAGLLAKYFYKRKILFGILGLLSLMYFLYIIFHKVTPEFDFLIYPLSILIIIPLLNRNSLYVYFIEKIGGRVKFLYKFTLPIYIVHPIVLTLFRSFTYLLTYLLTVFIFAIAYTYILSFIQAQIQNLVRVVNSKPNKLSIIYTKGDFKNE